MTVMTIFLTDDTATTRFGHLLATLLQTGDCVALVGDIGAGKTALSRSIIQARLGRAEDVPSPTFTLVQTYDAPDGDIWHCDLYRLTSPDEVLELGLDEAFDTAICLIEWPDRLGDELPKDAIIFEFTAKEQGRQITATYPDYLAARIAPAFKDD